MDAITQNKSNKFMQNFSSYEKREKQSFYNILFSTCERITQILWFNASDPTNNMNQNFFESFQFVYFEKNIDQKKAYLVLS